jgi:hypothetical protein
MRYLVLAIITVVATLFTDVSFAGVTDVVGVRITQRGDTYNFAVTVRHADVDWDYYANICDILTLKGKVICTRVLANSQDNKQPFTHSLCGMHTPANIVKVRMCLRDKVHGYGGAKIEVYIKTGQASPGGGQS